MRIQTAENQTAGLTVPRRTATKARTANGSRSASRGIGVPALSVLAARRARSIWARHSATE